MKLSYPPKINRFKFTFIRNLGKQGIKMKKSSHSQSEERPQKATKKMLKNPATQMDGIETKKAKPVFVEDD